MTTVTPLHLPALQDPYTSVLTSFVLILYRFTNVDDVVFAVSDHTKSSYSYLRYTIPEGALPFSILYKALKKCLEETPSFLSVEALSQHLDAIELSHSQKRDFNNYLFNVGSPELGSLTFEFVINYKDGEFFLVTNTQKYSDRRVTTLVEQIKLFVDAVAQDETLDVLKIPLLTPSQTELPSPTTDLDWSGYVGAIHEIFDKNAAKWPLRTCVIETGSTDRVFTYKQISQASNVIAHHLVDHGIVRGDVVTIYSYRSVELLVCVLGILKAGATFSVIDPAYPAFRQNIYLQVAQPAGLIVIGRAGKLEQEVEDYITKELSLKARISEVSLLDDGLVKGGLENGVDCLDKYVKLQDTPTGVEVGPDLNPTLAFTLGLEGIPKGVLGRHFSLAYYFPWMAERFGLSDQDNFTMLLGIAHDPIQRDMFTPIFLGAKIVIPTADDIGTPGRLARWMAKYKITVTHLTPAMGQVLALQAVDEIPTLKNAFFVGDLLTRKDCLRLQSLGKNVRIINMYGTTETQRAVSYYLVRLYNEDKDHLSSLKDIVPAGQGMKNVQLLVVNRADPTQTCGVGEVGELFVRAAGLAEGYCGLPELNNQKFVQNWFVKPDQWKDTEGSEPWRKFWKGPRDRLYRTGDLGRYLPDGNVEVTGRIDDQIKIRGFRIELGEIDTHVSKFAPVRENRTIVKKDENGDSYLITFLVLKDDDLVAEYLSPKFKDIEFDENTNDLVKLLTKYHKLALGLKKFLGTRLANYAIPSVVVVLPKFPLNPNGKIDKNKLPVPKPEELAEASKYLYQLDDGSEDLNEVFTPDQIKVRQLWYDILPNKPVISLPQDSFFELGGHSILATRMIFQVRSTFGVDLPLGSIFKHPSLEAFAKEIEKAKVGKSDQVEKATSEYSQDAEKLVATLPKTYPAFEQLPSKNASVLVTGTTGFLGLFLVKELLTSSYNYTVYAHVRADSEEAGRARLVNSLETYGLWSPEYSSRIHIVLGDLSKPCFGLPESRWKSICDTVDSIIHNGAMVHWVYPYSQLRSANVISTINLMLLALEGKKKSFIFVSLTLTLDTEHYFNLGKPVSEEDDLSGSASGLGTGYGQLKWVAEKLVREAGKRGLRGWVVRPGYVTGASYNGLANTDDFLIRLLKGSIELGAYPADIENSTNAVPVDHVAKIVAGAASELLFGSGKEVGVCHVTGHPRIKLCDYLSASEKYGYPVKAVPYSEWKKKLEAYVSDSLNPESALYPLLHMVLGDLGADTRAPELDDLNTERILQHYGSRSKAGVDIEQVGIYMSYLVEIGFLPKGGNLPKVEVGERAKELVSMGGGVRRR